MTTPEQSSQPPFYSALFTGYAGIAAAHGTLNHDPLDSSFAPGLDGTLTHDGQQAFGYEYAIEVDDLTPALRDKGILRLELSYYSSAIVEEDIWPERVRVETYETVGIRKVFTFYKHHETNEITATRNLYAEDGDDAVVDVGLSDEAKNVIIDDLFSGQTFWLKLDGPEGDFARSLHVGLTAPRDIDADDIDLLRLVFDEISR